MSCLAEERPPAGSGYFPPATAAFRCFLALISRKPLQAKPVSERSKAPFRRGFWAGRLATQTRHNLDTIVQFLSRLYPYWTRVIAVYQLSHSRPRSSAELEIAPDDDETAISCGSQAVP